MGIASEALFDGAPVAHIVAFVERNRLAQINSACRAVLLRQAARSRR